MMHTTNCPYSVSLWGSHPKENNDDCWIGDDFESREQALAVFGAVVATPHTHPLAVACGGDWEFVVLDGPDVHKVAENPNREAVRYLRKRRLAQADAEWKREHADQVGMAVGANGHNDEMGC